MSKKKTETADAPRTGAPRKLEPMSARVLVPCLPADEAAWRKVAEKKGLHAAAWIRMVLREAAEAELKPRKGGGP